MSAGVCRLAWENPFNQQKRNNIRNKPTGFVPAILLKNMYMYSSREASVNIDNP